MWTENLTGTDPKVLEITVKRLIWKSPKMVIAVTFKASTQGIDNIIK